MAEQQVDMTRFFVDSEVVRIDLEDDQWVEVKKEMNLADWETFEKENLRIQFKKEEGTEARRAEGSFYSSRVLLLEVNIKKWSFTNLQLTRKNISNLRRVWGNKIEEVINDLNLSPKEQETAEEDQT